MILTCFQPFLSISTDYFVAYELYARDTMILMYGDPYVHGLNYFGVPNKI